MQIVVKKGLDIPIKGKPIQNIVVSPSKKIALELDSFEDIRFKLLVKEGDIVKIGTALVENKAIPGQVFVSPAGGKVVEVRRGLKRRLSAIVIEKDENELIENHGTLDVKTATKEEIFHFFLTSGLFAHIRARPFDLIANPAKPPRDIFVRAIESLPFVPSAEMQIEGQETYFEAGLETLAKIAPLHLVYRENSSIARFNFGKKHTVVGPHPAGTSSLHIHKIAPIEHVKDYVWTLSAIDVITIGKMVREGIYYTERVLSIAGTGFLPEQIGYFKGRLGLAIDSLLENRATKARLISGDPLTGKETTKGDFLGFYHTCLSAIPENFVREPFHFLGIGQGKYSATKAYISGHKKPPPEGYAFTTNQHGEHRAFVDPNIYDKVMPMKIPTMFLIRSILAENFELAETLGLFEVTGDDFALPTFICPSKIEMMQIVKEGLSRYAKEH